MHCAVILRRHDSSWTSLITLSFVTLVAASRVGLSLTSAFTIVRAGQREISECPFSFYGREYSMIDVSYPDSSITLCFKNDPSETATDCLLIEDGGGSDRVRVTMKDAEVSPGSWIHKKLQNIKSTSNCFVNMLFRNGGTNLIRVRFYNFGSQTALLLKAMTDYTPASVVLAAKVSDSTLRSWTWTNAQALKNRVLDVSGCRYSDATLTADSEMFSSETCAQVTCNPSAVVSAVSTCGPLEVCAGNNTCAPTTVVCTVTGSTVIDFFNNQHPVPDRCAYTLMKPQGSSGYELLAVFKERRRKNVAFLDHLILSLSGKKVYLEQGGRVRVNDQTLTLSTEFQTFHNVELLKDQTGVTAKIPSSTMKVIFDGNTAHVTGLVEASEGLCGFTTDSSQTTTPTAEKSSPNSADGCEIQHSDTNNTSIHCSRSTDHCNLMMKAPFTSCHNHTDPEPFITACTNTLCHYPEVDGLRCQFFEAYAESCGLKDNITLEDWRSTIGCSADPHSCQDQYCSDHEFCGEKTDGTRCFCRALFASKYKDTNTLGEPTVCHEKSATLSLAECLLEDKGINYTTLHLNDQNCAGHLDDQTHMVAFSFDNSNTCGTEVTMNNSQVIYKNTIRTRNSSTDIINRQGQVEIDFLCLYTKPEIKSVTFKINDNSVIENIVSARWNYTLLMTAYIDPDRTNLVRSDTEIKLNQRVWLKLKASGLNSNVVSVVIDSCWATNQQSPYDSLRYDLIKNGCPDDPTVDVVVNGQGWYILFSFDMFRFSAGNHDIYVHCQPELCLKQDQDCVPSCSGGGRRKRRSFRSKYVAGNSALITMAWTY